MTAQVVLGPEYYGSTDTLTIAKDLLGKVLRTHIDGQHCSAMITETEAYLAPEDRASHAYQYRRTTRNESMYAIGGTCYMYICYGIHQMFNIATGPVEHPHAILIRAVEPISGIDTMLRRRSLTSVKKNLTAGPGLLCQAMGLDKSFDGHDLTKGKLVWIERRETIRSAEIVQTTRIGIDSCGEAVQYPYRFYIKDNPWVSKK